MRRAERANRAGRESGCGGRRGRLFRQPSRLVGNDSRGVGAIERDHVKDEPGAARRGHPRRSAREWAVLRVGVDLPDVPESELAQGRANVDGAYVRSNRRPIPP